MAQSFEHVAPRWADWVGILSIIVAILLFFLDRLLPSDEPAGVARRILSIAGSPVPWLAAFVVAVVVLLRLFASNRRLSHQLRVAVEFNRRLSREPQAARENGQGESEPTYRWLSGWEDGHGELLIQNSELEAFYERAVSQLREMKLEAQLSGFSVWALPFGGPKWTHVTMNFWAESVGREYAFYFDQLDLMTLLGPGSVPHGRKITTFSELPWRAQPRWCEMIRLSAMRVGKLVPDKVARFDVVAYPRTDPLEWRIHIDDFATGRAYDFEGTSPQDLRAPPEFL